MWQCKICGSTDFYFEENKISTNACFDENGNLKENKAIIEKIIRCNECGNETQNQIKEIATFKE